VNELKRLRLLRKLGGQRFQCGEDPVKRLAEPTRPTSLFCLGAARSPRSRLSWSA